MTQPGQNPRTDPDTRRTVLVTGGAHGIGAATATAFAEAGDHVAIADIDLAAASEQARVITDAGGSATAHRLDVSSTAAWERLSDELRAADRAPAVVVNNAFRYIPGAAHEIDDEAWNTQIDVTLGGVWRSLHTFHDALRAAHGNVVNVSSVHALLAWPKHPAYAAAKGGVVALTRQLSFDYAPDIRVNAVLPGSIRTRVWDTAGEDAIEAAVAQATLRRLGAPEEVARVIRFLASDEASYVTGVALPVDGGQTTTVAT